MPPAQNPYAAPQGPVGYGAAPSALLRYDFQGSGGALFVKFLVGAILTGITFGIYYPWFVCTLANYFASVTTLGPTARGRAKFNFTGTGGKLFVTYLVNILLTMITFGIYLPWAICAFTRYFVDNTEAMTEDGTRYRGHFDGTGGALFVKFLIGYLLTLITFGIYAPWFVCTLQKYFLSHMSISENGQQVARFDFVGSGTSLLGTFIVGYLLTMITFGIYGAWFNVSLWKFMAKNTRIQWQQATYTSDFDGGGTEFFGISIVGAILSVITIYIYLPWFIVSVNKFYFNHHTYQPLPPGQA
jgi:uncharacterized membrane protein YjgN (DUF898 family)